MTPTWLDYPMIKIDDTKLAMIRYWFLQVLFFEPIKQSYSGNYENRDNDPVIYP